MTTNLNQADKRWNAIILLIYALIIFLFLLGTGTFFSGYHLIDDQTYIILNSKYRGVSFLPSAYDAAREDLYLRFRPLAMVYYVAIAKWIYPSFTGIAMILALQGIFSCYFFFRFARILKCGLLVSFLFPLFVLVGNQGVIFWRNCMSETLCMLLISLSLYYLARSLAVKTGKWNIFFFSVFLLLSTFVKESFIILVPAILFLKIWQEALGSQITLTASLKRNLPLLLFFIFVIIAEISIIYYYKAVSNHFIDYVSIDNDTFKPYHLLVSLFRLLITKGYFIAIIPTVVLIIAWRKKNYLWVEALNDFFLPLAILILLIVVPQIILYSKSLIFERYLLPGTLSSGLVILFLHQYISRHDKQLKWLPHFFLPFCGLILLVQVTLMTRDAVMYARDGYAVKSALTAILDYTTPSDTILVVAQPRGQSEPAQSIRTYLNAPIGKFRKNVFIEPVIDSIPVNKVEQSDVNNFLNMTRGTRYNDISNKNNIGCILFFENVRNSFLSRHPELNISAYQRFDIGRFTIYCKKKNNS